MSLVELVPLLVAYECGELDEDGVLELFQHLVDSGIAWQLQGSYGRAAMAMIEAGVITPPTTPE